MEVLKNYNRDQCVTEQNPWKIKVTHIRCFEQGKNKDVAKNMNIFLGITIKAQGPPDISKGVLGGEIKICSTKRRIQ